MVSQKPQRILQLYGVLLHIVGLTSFTISFRYLFSLSTKISHSFGGHFQQLTNLCLLCSTFTFALGLYTDMTRSPSTFKTKNWVLSFIAPMELIITLSYWSLLAYNPSLIINTRTAGKPPVLVDMGHHLFPAIFLLLDSAISPPLRFSKRTALVVIVGIIGAYGVWAVVCKSRNGFWVYPIIGKLVVLERVVALTAWVGVVWGAWCFIEWGKLRLQVGEVKRKKV